MNKLSILDVDVRGKRVFCRVDFNVPLDQGEITDDNRIRAALPTIRHLTVHGAKVILASHLGRPKGKVVEELRLTPVAERLSQLLGQSVVKTDQTVGEEVEKEVAGLKRGISSCWRTSASVLARKKMTRNCPGPLLSWPIST